MKLKPHDLVVCCWQDITSNDGWLDPEEAEDYAALNCAICGWFVSEDKKFLRLTSCVAEDQRKNVVCIPKGCITNIQVVAYKDFKFED